MSTKTLQGLIAHCEAQHGLPYLYGEFGRVVTPAIVREKHRQYPDMTSAERAEKALKTHVGKRCYDCTGLIKSYWMQDSPIAPAKYAAKYDKNAQGLYDLCKRRGAINSMPDERGTLVFMHGERRGVKRMTHVGIYLGDGFVQEARGFDHGVVRTRRKERAWTHWGAGLRWLEENAPAAQNPTPAPTPKQPTTAAKPPVAPGPHWEYTMKQGDTLWALASRYLGSGTRWKELAQLNGIKDEKKVPIGKKIKIPGVKK